MAEIPSIADRLIDASLVLVAARGWARLTMAEVAREAGVSLAEAIETFRSKGDLLSALLSRVDRRMLQGAEIGTGEPVRDRLFEVIMRRFDVLQPHKTAISRTLRELPRDPLSALPLIPRFAQSMLWMLEAAGVSTAGPFGLVRAKGLAAVYLSTLRVWLTDDSADLSRTMAALDKALSRVDVLVRRLPVLGGTMAATAGTAPASDAAPDAPDEPPTPA